MTSRRSLPILVILVAFVLSAWADSKRPDSGKRQPMTKETRMYIIRGLQSELAFARKPFPMSLKGLTYHEDGTVAPSPDELAREMAATGPAVRPGDRVRITNVKIEKSVIVFEINGGPKKKTKWYEHIQVGMGGPATSADAPAAPDKGVTNPRGTLLTLQFKDFVPEMTPDQLKKMLEPVLDFSSKSAAEAYLDTIPPKAKEAIKNHQVLVGMNQEMVTYAKGRAPKRIRETGGDGKPYEEWIYGEPPQDVEFVRFVNGEVVRLEVMKVDGEKLVRTEKEIDLKSVHEAEARKREETPKPQPVSNRPTLRRPGEEVGPPSATTSGSAGTTGNPQPEPEWGSPSKQPPQPGQPPPPPSSDPSTQADPGNRGR